MQAGSVLVLLLSASTVVALAGARQELALYPERLSPQDLKLSGHLFESSQPAVRFVAYEELLELPQQTFSPKDDGNFPAGAVLSGIPLEELIRAIAVPDSGLLVAAVCYDKYEAHYTAEYRAAHHPMLVLRIGGEPPPSWPKSGGSSYGPYLISHASFTPAFHVLSHSDEPQIPYGVLELRFLRENEVLNALLPAGKYAADSSVMQGYRIAFQNCFRCHNEGPFGGRKAGVNWETLAQFAALDPAWFAEFVHDPKSRDSKASMPGNPQYDAKTLQALTGYFQAFSRRENR
jgi:mono/diheme cytochrome c family protein